MKVLWFTNTPCSAAAILRSDTHRGGWLQSLEQQLVLHEDTDLHISFYFNRNLDPFKYKNTTYHPVFRNNTGTKTGRWINRIAGKTRHDKKEVQQLLAVIKRVNPDLIHIHGTEENFGLVAALTGVPVVISLQGLLTPYAEKYYAGIPKEVTATYEGIKQKFLFTSAGHLFTDLKKQAERERAMLANARYVMGRTGWDKKIAAMLAPLADYFYGGEILRPGFYNNMWGKEVFTNKIRIVSVSSEALYKGFEMIVQTAGLLAARQQFDVEWLVIGLHEGNGSVRIVKKWLTADFEKSNIVLAGSKTAEEIIEILLSADVYCQVSHIENSPNSLCEAMLLGMPVVAANTGGTDSLVTDREDGILVHDGDAPGLAGAIAEIAADISLAKTFGRKARVRALERHNAIQICTDLLKTYNTILSQNR